MSELTETVRKMLSQAQVFARDTPFEAVSRARQAVLLIDAALAGGTPIERPALESLRKVTASRLEKYEIVLASWREKATLRAEQYVQTERARILQPLRAKG
ncbi:MAG: hypothetical protein RLZZ450_6094 [Pseudomonadota bacterium]|jgi:hypothetical protein